MNKPTRTAAVDHLTENLSFCLAGAPDIKGNAEEINAALAFCELAVSLPPAWFTHSERVTVCTLIQALYGDPIAFISNLNDGNISYYNKMIAKMRERGEGGTWELGEVVMLMIQKHTEEFGSLTI
jgi:hypothetical protein